MTPLVSIRGVRKSYGSIEVLRGIDLDIHTGERIAVIGRSGSGKSTLLRCINGLEPIDAGTILFEGRPVEARSRRVREIREQIGFVFQNFNLFPHLTALDNAAIGLRVVKHVGAQAAAAAARAALAQVGLAEKADAQPSQLSGGQQQRVAIARALAMEPKLLLFDEPTSALDPELIAEVLIVIRQLAASRRTMVLVTHEMRFASRVADRVIFIDQGRIEFEGLPAVAFGDDAPVSVKSFVRLTEHEV